MTSTFNLKANLRTTLGSSDSRRIRKAGQVPAVIYNKGSENLNIVVDSRDFEHQYFKGNVFTTVAHIELNGKKLQAIARKVELNPVTDKPEHVDFVQFDKGATVKVQAKLNFINKDKSVGLKRGGFLHVVLRKIEILCNPDLIPDSIDIDTATLRVGSKIRTGDLQLPENVKLSGKPDSLVASIIGRGSKDDDKADTTTEGAAPAADAKAGAAKAPAAAKAAPAAGKEAAKKPAAKK
jgi:large subunit ribosomal protein L25